ncbi:MAG TPA: hypothetical protein VMV40_09210 [Acidiferrobacter sp.]|nr:hypothetical protein [Acidiferrobacter sp.]
MNVILLPILTVLVLAFAYRFIGQLVAMTGAGEQYYNTDAVVPADSFLGARLRDFGILGTPLLLAGAAFGLRFGWAPAFLWILLAATTVGASAALAQSRLITPTTLRAANAMARLFISAILALLWAGLAAQSPHALLTFFVLYLTADRLMPLLAARRAELVGGLLLMAAIGVLFAALGVSWPLALTGSAALTVGPYHRLAASGPLFFYALLFLMLILKKRHTGLDARPAYGALGALLLGGITILVFLAALVGHPTIRIPRLSHEGLLAALPLLASALPFGAALAPLGDNALVPSPRRTVYLLILLQGAAAVGFLISLTMTFGGIPAWQLFFTTHPGAVPLIIAAVTGNAHLMGLIGLGPWVSQLLLASLLLLTVAAMESQQEQLAKSSLPKMRVPPLMATALLGALLWLGHGLSAQDQIMIGALFGIGAASALILWRRALPRFVVSLGLVLLVLADIALIAIGWAHLGTHPVRAGLSGAVMITEAVAAALFWRTRSRPEDYASRRSGHQS